MYKNIFYFREIKKIGGTEQFLYEIAKKYKDYDITIFYGEADYEQLQRLRKYVRCEKANKSIECEKAFFNFNIDFIDQVKAKEYIFICHANYEELGYKPPINKKITKVIGVSKFATDKIKEFLDKIDLEIKYETCYNPLTLEPKEKIKLLISAGRLDDKVKGRTKNIKINKCVR